MKTAISNLLARIYNSYMSKRAFIPHSHFKLTATVVNTLICEKFLRGLRIILPEPTRFMHIVRTDCIYDIEPNFVSAHRYLIDDCETLKPDFLYSFPYFAGSYDLERNQIKDSFNGTIVSNVETY